jgi:predicted secreted protein
MLTISQKDNAKEIPVRVGDSVEVILFENPGTGYQWKIIPDDGISIVENGYKGGGKAVGSGGHRHIIIRLDGPGRRELQGRYRRPWDQKDEGTEFRVTFLVSGENG